EQVDEHHDRYGADRERREAEQTDEEELERQHHASSLLRSAAAGAQSPPEVNRVHSQMSSVASAGIARAPPRLALMRSTRPSLRARLNWMAKVSSTRAAMTTGIQTSGLKGAKTPTASAPTTAATHTGMTLRNEMATRPRLRGAYTYA